MNAVPTTQQAQRIATLFRRKLTTGWSDREISKYRKLVKAGAFDDPKDFELICKYYEAERKKGDNGRHRRDLDTFINNYMGELDRARAWEESRKEKQKRARRTERAEGSNSEVAPLSDDEFKQVGEEIRKQIQAWKEKFQHAA